MWLFYGPSIRRLLHGHQTAIHAYNGKYQYIIVSVDFAYAAYVEESLSAFYCKTLFIETTIMRALSMHVHENIHSVSPVVGNTDRQSRRYCYL